MCTFSMVAQDWNDRHPQWIQPIYFPPAQITPLGPADLEKALSKLQPQPEPITRSEFDALKKELEAVKKLLLAAKEYDRATGQPDCEDAEKIALFKRLAQLTGVSMDGVFGAAK